jgi:hypothetical protein
MPQCVFPIRGRDHFVPLRGQIVSQRDALDFLVIDYEDTHRKGTLKNENVEETNSRENVS